MKVAFLSYPEIDVAVLSFFLHFVWEFWQAPWFAEVAAMPHLDGIILCSRATLGDVMIALGAYTAIALVARDRYWARCLTVRRVAGFLFIGLAVTIAFEWLATRVLDRWQYGADMPIVPVLGTGLAPVLQWIVIPLVSIITLRRLWFPRRSHTAR